MSRNAGRVPGDGDLDNPIPKVDIDGVTPPQTNSELNWITPTEFVAIPSRGLYYEDSHPLHNKEIIEIKSLSTYQEDILNNKSYIKKGVAVDLMLKSILVDKKIDIDSLFTGDKNALVVSSRIDGYGSDYVANMICPVCEKNFEHKFELDKLETLTGGPKVCKEAGYDVEQTGRSRFSFSLPRMKADIEVKLMNGNDEKYILNLSENKKKNKLKESPLTDMMKVYITAVSGKEDKNLVNKLVTSMPASDSRHIRKIYSLLMPNINLEQKVTHEACEIEMEVTMPFGASFFWPK